MALREAFDSALPAPDWLSVPAAGVHVALFDLHDWWPWLADAYTMLDAAEVRRVQSRRVVSDRHQLALGYSLHRLLLGKALECDAVDVPIRRDAKGGPYLAGNAVATSLSHADHCVAVAVAASGRVGVDVELAARAPVVPEIAERVCHPADHAGMADLPGLARSEAMLALWVRKEAFLKAAGIGLQREMQTFAAPDHALLALPSGGMTRVRMLDTDPLWVAAVASAPELPVESAVLRPLTSIAVT
ncbi:4'-phosphopantetheinyl transferase family protein [Lysobacter solisilvae (ex Woo and Kim 2022)]|uniref:4'-phosphopantetheinyl transferase superfamily protein n=1 Tax=Agrilutibacter terrestris TaxID=2865112 RepID=A0A7H0FXB3_9GAMM|nr:4'-phosphopantetheinyl transferase superfamily protein [Lysobacter terrestris]QNP40679.1 4'-phosphopantetheinyl transferase superfamily protein [Lysobacter terrestris]